MKQTILNTVLTVLLIASGNKVFAGGKYKATADEADPDLE